MNFPTKQLGALLSVSVLAACGGASASQPAAVDVAANEVSHTDDGTTLNHNTSSFEVDGITVIHKRTPGNAIVDVRVFIDGGSAIEPVERSGRDGFALNVAFAGGPSTMEKAEFTGTIEAIGASMGGGSGYDYATASVSVVRPFFDEAWEVFAQVIRRPAFRETEIELRRELALANLNSERDDPDSAVGIIAKQVSFSGSRYANRPSGELHTIEALTLDDLQTAWASLWVKERLTVVVVGDLDRAALEQRIRATFGDLPSDPAFVGPTVSTLTFETPTVQVTARPELPTNYILGYFAAPPVSDPDYPALQAALSILSDRLFEEVRTARNLSYAVSSGLSQRRLATGYLYVTAEQPNVTLQVMLDTVDGMIDPQVPEQDLHDQIEGYLTGYFVGLQSNGAQASLLGYSEVVAGDRLEADRHLERLLAVTADDVARVLETYVRNIQFVVIGDPDAIDTTLFTSR